MSVQDWNWMNNIENKVMLVFKDLEFKERTFGGICAQAKFENGFMISVIASKMAYSTPREDKDSADDFSSFEVAIMDGRGEFVTKDFVPDHHDDVLGWQSRGQINALMLLVQSKKEMEKQYDDGWCDPDDEDDYVGENNDGEQDEYIDDEYDY